VFFMQRWKLGSSGLVYIGQQPTHGSSCVVVRQMQAEVLVSCRLRVLPGG
jgi:hypothetical protein